jgi:hypothetical protein
MKKTHNKIREFLIENEWIQNTGTGLWYHWKYTDFPDFQLDEFVTFEEAMEIQKEVDPEGYSEFQLLNNLDSKSASMYSKYMDS